MTSPFEFGRALSSTELVDRQDEVAEVRQALEGGGRLFLIGPRRFGKTSILRAAAEGSRAAGVVVLHYNAEAYPALSLLARSIVADAAKELTPQLKKAGQKVQQFFGTLRPQLTYNPLDGSFSATLGTATGALSEEVLLVEALDGLDRLAADTGRRVAVVIDEFQQVVEGGGVQAEGQVRAAVQRHDHVAYVFAGSKTAFLSEMTGSPNRPFYRLGTRRFVGPVPRSDFRPFLLSGFASGGFAATGEAIEALLDFSDDVPYNVQRLAHACWNALRDRGAGEGALTAPDVQAVLERLVSRDDPFYTQVWNRLTAAQQKALLGVAESKGTGLYTKAVLKRYGLALSTMRRSLDALVRAGIAREEEARGSVRYRLEDPFLAVWLHLYVVNP